VMIQVHYGGLVLKYILRVPSIFDIGVDSMTYRIGINVQYRLVSRFKIPRSITPQKFLKVCKKRFSHPMILKWAGKAHLL